MKVIALLLTLTPIIEAHAGDEPPVEVFVPGTAFEQGTPPESSRMIERRYVGELNTVELARGNPNLRLTLPSGDSADFAVRTFSAEAGFEIDDVGNPLPSENPSDLTYFLQANGPAGQLFLTVREGRVTGNLIGADPWSIEYANGDIRRHFVDDIDRTYLGSGTCGTETAVETEVTPPYPFAPVAPEPEAPVAPTASFEVTVLFAYTPEALTLAGSVQALRDRAAASINQMNQALVDSGETSYTRVAQVGDVYASSINELTYSQQAVPSERHKYIRDQTLQEELLVAERENVDADLVVTFVADEGNGPGQPPVVAQYGRAYLQRENCSRFGDPGHQIYPCNPGPDFERWAFGVVAYAWATQNATFPHEVGHLFGAEHEPQRGSTVAERVDRNPYAHRSEGVVRDHMAQLEGVDDSGSLVCSPAMTVQFSNPYAYFINTTTPSGVLTPVYPAMNEDYTRYRYAARIVRRYSPAMSDFEGATQPTDRVFWDGFE